MMSRGPLKAFIYDKLGLIDPSIYLSFTESQYFTAELLIHIVSGVGNAGINGRPQVWPPSLDFSTSLSNSRSWSNQIYEDKLRMDQKQ